MVSKCCWRESAKQSPETEIIEVQQENCQDNVSNAGSTTALLCTYEDDCDKQLEITDLTTEGKVHQHANGSCLCFRTKIFKFLCPFFHWTGQRLNSNYKTINWFFLQ